MTTGYGHLWAVGGSEGVARVDPVTNGLTLMHTTYPADVASGEGGGLGGGGEDRGHLEAGSNDGPIHCPDSPEGLLFRDHRPVFGDHGGEIRLGIRRTTVENRSEVW